MTREIDAQWWRSGTVNHRPMAEILRAHDFAQVFSFLRSRGWSVAAIGAAVGLTETRIRAICAGKQRITSYDVIERIALGFGIERGLLGLAYTDGNDPDSAASADDGRSPHAPTGRRSGIDVLAFAPEHETTSEAAHTEESLIMNIADESARHGRRAGHSNIADRQLDELEEAVERLCVDIIDGSLIPLVRELRQLRDDAFTVLEGRQYPRQSRRLYAIGARACGLLAATTADRFGLYDVASMHARTATIAAEFSEDPALDAWTASLHCTIAFWQGRYRSAATIAQRARRREPVGVEAARLASLEARAWAKLGDRDAMRAAMAAAEAAREHDGPQAGKGVMAFPYANQVRVVASASLWIGDYANARTQLARAIDLLVENYDSPAHLAAARMDLADAHLHADALDDAAAALQPLTTETGVHLAGAARRGANLVRQLRASRYASSSTARQLVDDIEGFLASQVANGELERAGAMSDRALPR